MAATACRIRLRGVGNVGARAEIPVKLKLSEVRGSRFHSNAKKSRPFFLFLFFASLFWRTTRRPEARAQQKGNAKGKSGGSPKVQGPQHHMSTTRQVRERRTCRRVAHARIFRPPNSLHSERRGKRGVSFSFCHIFGL